MLNSASDNSGDFPTALKLYKRSLDYFMTGMKYEKNPSRRATVLKRVDGYMKRAEELKIHLEKGQEGKGNGKKVR